VRNSRGLRYLAVVPRIPVRALDRMVAFYTDIFGFAVNGQWPEDEPTFAMLERDDARLQLYVAADPAQCGAVILNVEVSEAQAVHAALIGRVTVEWGPEVYWYGRREFAARDPEGNLVIVTAETDDPITAAEDAPG
jgi:catechol 2,3-dioxygenase-like lactoylglutathione lyase family enzyme